ncbi:S8 family serine peptidase [Actinacidiphila rubida]|uniref:PA domain-containing protein n=1 Tax=Actinacidiphila rubida TaxID=310780 RepID=A0A1H8IZA3_9ACTN|nr:S8 family serine peptidase [Actinacidiphila rubida]SEN73812.1 PA domain-containing protein [Actinacidiphila rubida]
MKARRKRWSVPVAAGALVLALAGPYSARALTPSVTRSDAATPSAASAEAASDRVPAGDHTVTLITGDVVTTRQSPGTDGTSGGTVSVRGADGRPVQAHVLTSGDDLYVYPESTLAYVAQGILDRQLFNVTGLIADGYDDAHRARLPLIVSYTNPSAARRAAAVPAGATEVRTLDAVNGAALTADRAHAADFWTSVTAKPTATAGARQQAAKPSFGDGIAHIWLDGRVHADLADSTRQIGAPQVWAAGNTGQGVDVAVLDTGVDAGHPDLADRIASRQSFVPDENTDDYAGHGTHVASTIAGTGAASGGAEKGVAPGARLDIGKVLGNDGSGQTSWVLAGMQWAAVDRHARIINMSLGDGQASDGTDPLSQAVDQLSTQTGALFVVAAGNAGAPGTISSPGAATDALTVGAVDSTDSVADFSSQGPRVDGALKPEITAPGVDVLAANSQFDGNGLGAYQTMSGTSMATPHVAGAAALMAAAHPDLTGSQLKDLLAGSSLQTPEYDAFQAGSGRVDVAAASHAGVIATATAYAAQVPDAPAGGVQRPVTYTNLTDAPITLALSVEATHAPAGMFRLSAPRVVVPAHGTAGVTVTIDGSGVTADGTYTGQVEAKDAAGKVAAHTAVSLGYVEHKLTMTFKDAQGRPMSGVVELLRSGDDSPQFVVVDDSGTGQMFLPRDTYSVLSFKTVQGVHGPHSWGMALLGDPDVYLDRDTTVTLDASKVSRVDMTAPQRTETTYQRLDYTRQMGGQNWRDYMETQTNYDSLWAQPTTHKVTHGDFYLAARWRKEQPALSVSTRTTDFTDVLRQDGVTPLPTGRRTLPLVFAGEGASADYAKLDVRGKAVVVRRNDDVSDIDQAAAAIAAGARLMLVVNNTDGRGFRRYNLPFGAPAVPLDVALLSTDEGEKLVGQAQVRGAAVTVDSEPVSPYVYDLDRTWHNEIPNGLVVQGTARNLARVDETFASPAPGSTGGEFRFDWPAYNNWAIGEMMPEPVRGKRTDWVSTGGDTSWSQSAYADGLVFEAGAKTSYRPGSTQSEEWFKPIERPYLNDDYSLPTRTGDRLYIDAPAWGSRNHVGMSQIDGAAGQQQTLYQGTTQLGTGNFTNVSGTAPGAGKLPYRLVVTGQRAVDFTPYSSRTRTEWDFTSQATADGSPAVLPLVQLDYEIGTDSAGRAGRHDALSVTAAHLPGAAGAGRIGAVTLQVSYDDGATWHRAVGDRDGRYRLDAPHTASYVSLRATAEDSAGNAVDQTVIRAFGLR